MRRAAIAVGLLLAVLLGGCATSTPQKALVAPHQDAAWTAPVTTHEASICISTDCGVDGAALHWSLGLWSHVTTGYYVYVTTMTVGQQVADVHQSPWVIGGGDCGTSILLGVRQHDSSGDVGPLYSTTYTTPACTSSSTTSSTTSSSTTSSTTTSSTTSGGGAPPGTQPLGDPMGISWTLAGDDEFNGTSIDTNAWQLYNETATGDNGVIAQPANCSESGGNLVLDVPDTTHGCDITSQYQPYTNHPTGSDAFELAVGGYLEFNADFPICFSSPGVVCDSGFDPIANWGAVWASGPSWPDNGEEDVAEGLGKLTITYHGCSGTPATPPTKCGDNPQHGPGVSGTGFAGAFHTFGVYRSGTPCASPTETPSTGCVYYYWDGTLESTLSTDDNGQPQAIRFTNGSHNNATDQNGSTGDLLVNWVRMYTQ